MVVLVPDYDEFPTRMAIVDGFLPDKTTLKSAMQVYNQAEIMSNLKYSHTAIENFKDLTCLINESENNIMLNQQQRNRDALNHIHHYLIYHKCVSELKVNAVSNLESETILSTLQIYLPDASRSDYCLNILAAPQNLSNERIQNYLFMWLNETKLRVPEKNEYKDFNGYIGLCDRLFSRINAVYMDPLGKALNGEVNEEETSFSGVKLNR